MPWSPFPCSFSAASFTGVPGQRSNFCYSSGEAGALTANLSTNGYNNLFYGSLPDANEICGIRGDRARLVKMLLTVEFRLAAGRQFDRTYSFQVGDVVVSFCFRGESGLVNQCLRPPRTSL